MTRQTFARRGTLLVAGLALILTLGLAGAAQADGPRRGDSVSITLNLPGMVTGRPVAYHRHDGPPPRHYRQADCRYERHWDKHRHDDHRHDRRYDHRHERYHRW